MKRKSITLPEVQAKPAVKRIGIALTLMHLSAVTTKAESEWIQGLVMSHIDERPAVQEKGFGV